MTILQANIIDRRLNGNNKSAINRQKFMKRIKSHLKEAAIDRLGKTKITDVGKSGEKIKISTKELVESSFQTAHTGENTQVLPGNTDFNAGDRLMKRGQGEGGGGSQGGSDGDGDDEFEFELRGDEFMDILLDDLELPYMVKKNIKRTEEFEWKHAGQQSNGNPSNLNVVKSVKKSIGRRLALKSSKRRKIGKLYAEQKECETDECIAEFQAQIDDLERRLSKVPLLDDTDLLYDFKIMIKKPVTSAVMFCMMDVSGSMGEYEKDLAKRFYLLLYTFLRKEYTKVDIVYIRHHNEAYEVDEDEFFHSRDTGGTVVSVGLELIKKIINERYNDGTWNCFVSQCSDGDNWPHDTAYVDSMLREQILPIVQYYAYVEIAHPKSSMFSNHGDSDLWATYKSLSEAYKHFVINKVATAADIYPTFKKLFEKRS